MRRIPTLLLAAFAFAAAVPLPGTAMADAAYSRCMEESDGTNVAWSECGGAWNEREDDRLNAVWKDLMTEVQGDTRRLLVEEQRAWVAFKEKVCGFWHDGDFGREGQVLHGPSCLAETVSQRTATLRELLDFLRPKN